MEQVNGALLVPAATMVEMSAAAAGLLSEGEAAVSLLARLSISAPLVLPGVAAPAAAVVSISRAGHASILSEAATARQATSLHCSCSVATMAQQPSGALTCQQA